MEYNFSMTLDSQFKEALEELHRKYGTDMMKIEGMAPSQLDVCSFYDKFMSNNTVADSTIDDNANVTSKNINTMKNEGNKPHAKLLSRNKLFIEMKEEFGVDVARDFLEKAVNGEIYEHDSHDSSYKPYCFAFSLKNIVHRGLYFIEEMEAEKPEHWGTFNHHVLEFISHATNLQSGAVGIPDYLIYAYYFFKKDTRNMSEEKAEEFKEQRFQEFIFSLNQPYLKEGIQCVTEDAEVLTPNGFKTYDKLSVGDDIYTWDDGELNIQKVKEMNVTDYKGEMHEYKGESVYQKVSPNHRVLRKKYNNKNDYILDKSKDIIDHKTPTDIPVAMTENNIGGIGLDDEMIELLVMILTDGHIEQRKSNYRIRITKSDKRWGLERLKNILNKFDMDYSIRKDTSDFKGANNQQNNIEKKQYGINIVSICADDSKVLGEMLNDSKKDIPDLFLKMDKKQANLFIDTWGKMDGHIDSNDRMKLQCDNYDIADKIQHIMFLAGYGSRIAERVIGNNKKPTLYVIRYLNQNKSATEKNKVEYEGKIWCPTTDDGVVVFRQNNKIFISGNSAYSNVSILDKPHIEGFFEGEMFPNGDMICDHTESIIEFQKDFMKYIREIRTQKWHTFPVISATLVYDYEEEEYEDEETAKAVTYHNWVSGFNDINMMNVEEVTSAASCCFDKDQEVLTKSRGGGVRRCSFEELDNMSYAESGEHFKIFHNGSWAKGNTVKIKKDNKNLYRVETANNKEFIVTDDHINPTSDGDKITTNLSTDDYLLFNNQELNTYTEKEEGLTYEQGVLIGAYLGDGSQTVAAKNHVDFSLNEQKFNNLKPILEKALQDLELDVNINLGKEKHNNYPVGINSSELVEFINRWVTGSSSFEKSLSLEVLLKCKDFREGILEGYYMTDGGNSNRIYSISKQLIKDIETLITSLGKNSTISVRDRTDEKVIIRGEEFDRNHPLYCIRWYDGGNQRKLQDLYKVKNNSVYFKITSIEEYETDDEFVYCFEMKNKNEPYFTLPNGLITHNCRLTSDVKKKNESKNKDLEGKGDRVFNSIGGSDLNVGSTKVVTLNLVRIGLLSDTKEEFKERVRENVKLIHKYHFAHRKTLQKLIDKGLLPLYNHDMMDLNDQFATVGINGVFEGIKTLGGISHGAQGAKYNDRGFEIAGEMFSVIQEENEKTKDKYGYLSNIEQAPAESAAVKLNKKDRIYFGNRKVNEELGEDCDIYGNQWIPLKTEASIFDRIEAAQLDEECGGGAILHLNLGENFNTFEDAWSFTQELARKGVKYFSYISLIDICAQDHSFFGETCPICGGDSVAKGIKIVGYLVKQDSYSEERKKELDEREFYDLN